MFAFRHTNNPAYDPNDVYIQWQGAGDATAQYKLPNKESLTALGIEESKVQQWFNTPMNYYKGELTSPYQLTSTMPAAQARIGGEYYKLDKEGNLVTTTYNPFSNVMDIGSWALNPDAFKGTTALPGGQAAEITDYQRAMMAGKESGMAPQDVAQQYATMLQEQSPEKYPSPAPTPVQPQTLGNQAGLPSGVQDQEYRQGDVLYKFDKAKGWNQIGTYNTQGNLVRATTTQPTSTTSTQGKELPFPTNQLQMTEYRQKYTFENGKWYDKSSATAFQEQATAQQPVTSQQSQQSQPLGETPAGENYKIVSGDTLSGIAQKYGTTVDALMKANPSIKNADLIYAGNTLHIPGTPTQQLSQIQQQAGQPGGALPGQTGGVAGGGTTGGGTTGGTTGGGTQNYQDWLASQQGGTPQQSYSDMYGAESGKLGIPGQRDVVKAFQNQILDVEGLLDDLEDDINSAISGKLVTTRQRNRYLATEGDPLREQMTDLMRAEARASTGLSGSMAELQNIMRMKEKDIEESRYESPTDAFARYLKEEAQKKEAGVGQYEPGTPTEVKGQLKQLESGEWAWIYPDGRVVKTGAKGKGDEPPTEADQLKVAKTDMKTQLMGVRGNDGYISPDDYKEAKEAWHQAGLSKRKFDEYFNMFVNPSHPQDYGLEGV